MKLNTSFGVNIPDARKRCSLLREGNLHSPENWQGVSIEAAVDATMQNYLRHEFTDHDQMLIVGVHRKHARQRVKPQVQAMMASWKTTFDAGCVRMS